MSLTYYFKPLLCFVTFILSFSLGYYIYNRIRKRNTLIIGIIGNDTSHEITTISYLKNRYKFKSYSLTDPLHKIMNIFGFDDIHNNISHPHWGITGREFLCKFEEMCNDSIAKYLPTFENVWLREMERYYEGVCKDRYNMVVTDIRLPTEEKKLRSLGGVIIKIGNIPNDDLEYHYVLNTSSSAEMYHHIDNIIHSIPGLQKKTD